MSSLSEIKSKCVPDAKLTVAVIGDGGVGKTAFCERYAGAGQFVKAYNPTTSTTTYKDVHCYSADVGLQHKCPSTSSFPGCVIECTVIDTCGQEKFGSIRDDWYQNIDGAILMFDVTARLTYRNVPSWYDNLQRVRPKLPVVLVGNKVDCKNRNVKAKDIDFHRKKNLQYYDVSVKTLYNTDKPLLYLVRKVLNRPHLCIAKCPLPECFWEKKRAWPDAARDAKPDAEPDATPDAAPAKPALPDDSDL